MYFQFLKPESCKFFSPNQLLCTDPRVLFLTFRLIDLKKHFSAFKTMTFFS